MRNEPKFAFDRAKFKDVVHYICTQCDPHELGNVKLHKTLYFSDMLSFLSTAMPMTGVEYQKQQFGPIARHLSWALSELQSEGRIKVAKRDYFGYQKCDYISLESPNTSRLSNSEIHLLNDVISFVCQRSAREISELSHNAAWEAAELGETIPYYSSYGLAPQVVSDEDVQRGIIKAHEIRAMIHG